MMRSIFLLIAGAVFGQQLPQLEPLAVAPRIGVLGETRLTLPEVIERVLAKDRDLEVSRILRDEAGYNVNAARGYYDPTIGLRAYELKSVTPVASSLGGGPNGKLTEKDWSAVPELTGASPWLGGTYELELSTFRQQSDNQFNSLNPQFPTSVALKLTQPLWRGLRFDENRHRLQVARRNQSVANEQFRQKVIEIVTQAVQAYWELDYARRNLDVQVEAVRLAEGQFESNRRQAEQGLLAPIEVVAAQTQNATFRQNVFSAQEALTRAENNLKQMITSSRDDLLWSTALIPETPPASKIDLPALPDASRQALRSRPELAQSDLSIEINVLDTRLNRELAKPRIDAFANFSAAGLSGRPLPATTNALTGAFTGLVQQLNLLSVLAGVPPLPNIPLSSAVPPIFIGGYGQSWNNLAGGNFPTAQAGIQFSLPLRNRTAEAQVAASAAEGHRLRALRDQLEMLIVSDVRNSLQSAASAQARLDAAILARQSAEQQYQSEQRQLQSGTSTVFLVLERQTDFITARTREVRATADLAEAAASLDRAIATTMEAHNIELKSAN